MLIDKPNFPPFQMAPFGAPMPELKSCPRIRGIAQYAMEKAGVSYEHAISAILATVSAATHGVIDVSRPLIGRCPTSLFMLLVAGSGAGKSTLGGILEAPIQDFESVMRQIYDQARERYEADIECWEAQRRSLISMIGKRQRKGEDSEDLREQLFELKVSKPKKPRDPRLFVEDATPEGLATHLFEGWGCATLNSNEGSSVLESRLFQNLAMPNKLWAAERWVRDRLTLPSFVLENVRLSVFIQIQPGALSDFLSKKGAKAQDIGLLARLLYCEPESLQGTRRLCEYSEVNKADYQAYVDRMNEILATVREHMIDPDKAREVVEFCHGASDLWIEVANIIEAQSSEGGRFQFCKPYAAKMAENIARIAALLTYFELGRGPGINREILKDAIGLAFYYADAFCVKFEQLPLEHQALNSLRRYFEVKRQEGIRYLKKAVVYRSGIPEIRGDLELFDRILLALINEGSAWLGQTERGMLVIDLKPHLPFDSSSWAYEISNRKCVAPTPYGPSLGQAVNNFGTDPHWGGGGLFTPNGYKPG